GMHEPFLFRDRDCCLLLPGLNWRNLLSYCDFYTAIMAKPPELSNDDIELFRRTVGSVKRMDQDQVITDTPKPRPIPEQSIKESQRIKQEMLTGSFESSELEIGDELLFIRPGIQKQVMRKLRRGQFSVEAELDLHGMIVNDAKKALSHFLAECTARHHRCVRIIHGKGLGSKDKRPLIKIKLNHWLQQRDEVLAFCSARPFDGGTGVAYVLLRQA
ncbi:MAG: Smr/MutS family protein, partial [Gammaproteobacteria bacterium]